MNFLKNYFSKTKNIYKKSIALKLLIGISGLSSLGIILFSSLVNIYDNRTKIFTGLKKVTANHGMERHLVNPLITSKREAPVYNLKDLKIESDAHLMGQWSAPIDWNVTAIHSVLLPDYSVMTFGTMGIIDKEDKGLLENKEIQLSDERIIKRDDGFHQWEGHSVNTGHYFDVWDFKKGFNDDSHQVFINPIVFDSFCTIARVIDNEKLFMVGGNVNVDQPYPDTQKNTTIYNIKDRTFESGKVTNLPRWYGSLVRTADEKLLVIGGQETLKAVPSIFPEMLDLNNPSNGWKLLKKAGNEEFFGRSEPINDKYGISSGEWWYPRSFLASDGNIVGISYNKIWMMDKNDQYRIRQTGEIELETGGIARYIDDVDQNNDNKLNSQLRLLTIGSPVGVSNSVLMHDKDIVYVFGGKQSGDEYAPSNKVLKIDFSESSKPVISKSKSMLRPRANGDATILPTGEIFINGGHSLNDLEFSIFDPEIYNPYSEESKLASKAYFRRNYHSTSLLLPNGTILVAGGDVWNAEVFYPPYLFKKDTDGNTVLEEKPVIDYSEKTIKRGSTEIQLDIDSPLDIAKFTMISTGAVTHANGSENKFRELIFTKSGKNKFVIEIPENKNELQNGTYMIFAIRKKGTPSNGIIVNLM